MVWKGKLNGKKDKIPRHPYIPRVNHVIVCVARQNYIYTLLLESHGHRHMTQICIIIQFYTCCTWLHRQSPNWSEWNETRLSSVPSIGSEEKAKCRESVREGPSLGTRNPSQKLRDNARMEIMFPAIRDSDFIWCGVDAGEKNEWNQNCAKKLATRGEVFSQTVNNIQ